MMNREEWHERMAAEVAPVFDALGKPLPKLRVSCGFPLGRKQKQWQVWPASASADGTVEVLITPTISDAGTVFVVLLNALAAAAGAGLHDVGLDPTGALADMRWLPIIDAAGEYPHAALNVGDRPTQTTRMLKASCPTCGYTVRLTTKWAAVGMPSCPVDNINLQLEQK